MTVQPQTRKRLVTPGFPKHTLSKSTPPIDLNRILGDALVTVRGYQYAVDFGPDVAPRMHYVSKEKRCSCELAPDCPAVAAVASYLKTGGARAPEPPVGYYPTAPALCPICGKKAHYEPSLSSPKRGAGWVCADTGKAHYWKVMGFALAQKFAANPWRFPPVVIREGQQLNAWDGIHPTDTVLYPGLLRADLA